MVTEMLAECFRFMLYGAAQRGLERKNNCGKWGNLSENGKIIIKPCMSRNCY